MAKYKPGFEFLSLTVYGNQKLISICSSMNLNVQAVIFLKKKYHYSSNSWQCKNLRVLVGNVR